MLFRRILSRLLCVTCAVIKSMRLEDRRLIVTCAPRKGKARRCFHCGRRAPIHDCALSSRRWRVPDLESDHDLH